jgi:hypothetical protein
MSIVDQIIKNLYVEIAILLSGLAKKEDISFVVLSADL